MAEPRKDLGENDASFVDAVSNAVEKAADAISHKLHPIKVLDIADGSASAVIAMAAGEG